MRDFTDDELFLSRLRFVANSLETLQALYEEACGGRDEDVPEKLSEEEEFAFRTAQLAGLSEQFTALGRKRPESACGTFKAQQVNRVLLPLKKLIGEDMGLVSVEGEQNYGDVSLLLRGWLDLCAEYALQHYDGNPLVILTDHADYRQSLVQQRILAFCQNEPKGILEIGEMLCYRDKKTVRKYLDPLLAGGWLARTVPDKPNSRNQKYVTARMI